MAEVEPMKKTATRRTRVVHAPAAKTPTPAAALPAAPPGVAALVQLAGLDGVLEAESKGPAAATPHQRESLTRQLSPEILDAYERALRAGRRPAVTVMEDCVCRGCHMRLHSSLAQRIHSRGAAACPHCLRVVYHSGQPAPAERS